jgi:hypothetical protein
MHSEERTRSFDNGADQRQGSLLVLALTLFCDVLRDASIKDETLEKIFSNPHALVESGLQGLLVNGKYFHEITYLMMRVVESTTTRSRRHNRAAGRFLRCGEGFDLLDAFPESSLGIPEIDFTLSIEPILRRVAKQARKPKSRLPFERAPLSKHFVDSLPRNS